MTKYAVLGASPLLLLTVLLAGCGAGNAEPGNQDAANAPLPVAVVAPHIADMAATYVTTASLAADREASIPARIGGDVVEILVEEGELVQRGQVLARLDGERARLAMRETKAQFDRLQRERDRVARLHYRGLVSSASRDEVIAELEAVEAAYARARLNVEYTMIRATIDGVVSERSIKIGAALVEGQQAFVVTDTADLVAYLDIPQNELYKFDVGQAAAIEVDSQPGTRFPAAIERLSPTIDADTGTFRATLAIDNRRGRLAPGMFAQFSIVWDTYPDALVIPEGAVLREDTETIVFVVENGEAVRRKVSTGLNGDGLLQIVDGIGLDDRIVLSGQARLRDGSRVLARSASPSQPVSG